MTDNTPTDDERTRALHDAFWAVHAGRFHGSNAEHGVNTFYAGTNAAKRAIENLHGSPIIRPWSAEVPEPSAEHQEHADARRAETMTLMSHSEPQGEPSEAQDFKIDHELMRAGFLPRDRDRIRAALRAAGVGGVR
jgi:hypothetical protein